MCPDLDCPLKVDFLNSNYWSPKPIVYYPFKLTLTNLSSSSSVGVWCLRCLRSFLTVCVILPSWWSCWHYYYYNYFWWFVGENFAKWPSLYYFSSVFQLMTFRKTANCLCTQRRRRVWKLRGSIAKSKYNHSSGLPEVISDAKTKIIERWMAGTDKVWLCLVRTGSSQNIFRFLHQKIIWEGWRTSQPRAFQPRTFTTMNFWTMELKSPGMKSLGLKCPLIL